MTQDYLAAANTTRKRVTLLVGMLISLTLAACGGGDSIGSADLNQPLAQPQTAPVAFAPITGAPPAISTKMVDALTAAAKEKNIQVVAAKDAEFSVLGFMQAGPESRGSRLTYIGDISDKSGKRVKRIQADEIVSPKKLNDAWPLVDDAAIQRIAAKTASDLQAWLSGSKTPAASQLTAGAQPNGATPPPVSTTAALTATPQIKPSAPPVSQAAAIAPAVKADATVYVQTVANAPGDGQVSLAAAMKKHLAAQGVRVAETKSPSGYTVRGNVEMGKPENGEQPIKISWQVVDPSGKPLSNAVIQRNKVDENSLNGPWGNIADAAAEAASVEVAKIVPRPTT
ncbi:MAG: hypothetical protein H7X92_03520 [Chitinophagales bacterium]|nr:hypothetical protein [Hyphomicrobiales bacterium]